ncbi:hypothetical protein QZM22_25265 [Burkholderia oklahomensis]|uniref:hypothetical protein n=1 Tax=Burkholderia oklahomensis TaxID=342113 RepID=UPI00264E4102|nr:hypothetical protein [Burkholderia oklahomensis]MDN7675723.1 hypothetical protein [Burkholderia oklahomensis]
MLIRVYSGTVVSSGFRAPDTPHLTASHAFGFDAIARQRSPRRSATRANAHAALDMQQPVSADIAATLRSTRQPADDFADGKKQAHPSPPLPKAYALPASRECA